MRERWLSTHQMLLAALMLLAPFLGAKVTHTFGLNWTAGILAVAVVYTLVDIINELNGPRTAGFTILAGSVIRIGLFVTLVPIALALPTEFAPVGWHGVVRLAARVLLAGELSVLLPNLFFDIPLFAEMRKRDIGTFFIRTNVTNVLSNMVATFIFVVVAFGGTPVATWRLFFGQLAARLLVTAALSPFSTLWVRWLNHHASKEPVFG